MISFYTQQEMFSVISSKAQFLKELYNRAYFQQPPLIILLNTTHSVL